jgi:hypothetical protein
MRKGGIGMLFERSFAAAMRSRAKPWLGARHCRLRFSDASEHQMSRGPKIGQPSIPHFKCVYLLRDGASREASLVSNKPIVLDLHDCVQTLAALIGDLTATRLAPSWTLLFDPHHPHIAAWTQRPVPYALVQFHRAILNRQCGTGVAVRWRGKEKED